MPASGFGCPTCHASGKGLVALVTGGMGFSCSNGHKFNDTEELLAMNPPAMPVAAKMKPKRDNLVEYKIEIPDKLMAALRAKFTEHLDGAVEAILGSILDNDCFIVSGLDLDRLKERTGTRIKNSATLIGIVTALKQEAVEAKKDLELFKSSVPTSAPGADAPASGDAVPVTLQIPVDDFVTIRSKAQFNSQSVGQYMMAVISNGLQNSWF